ncbi:MAG: preprotein translocase subunit SecG [Pirellulales bacterium]|nr:preprotein translocase subunit SecG [Pirellulales bacterium]
MQILFMVLMFLLAVLLILVILVQRGKGGGLAGALGGMGGQSAFGTKAGDLFTKITVGLAVVWILLLIVAVKVMSPGGRMADAPGQQAPANPDGAATEGPAGDTAPAKGDS